MRKTETFRKLAFTASIVVLVGSWAAVLSPHVPTGKRLPAAIDSKERILAGANSFRLPVSGKSHGLVEVVIAAPKKGGVGKGTIIELEATVEARADLDQLKFLWILPREGVSVVNGPVEGDIGTLKEADKTKLTLAIRSDSDENRRVHLHVYKLVNGEHMGKMAQYNTVNQEAIEWVASDKAEKLRKEAEANGSTVNKIYQ